MPESPSAKVLDTYARTHKDSTVVLGAIERHVLQRPDDGDRDMTQLHPSEISKNRWCPRKDYFSIAVPHLAVAEDFGFQTLRIFEEGHDIHAKWQLWLKEMGILWGKWKCFRCEIYTWGQSCDLGPCPRCGHPDPWLYKEAPLSLPSHALIGHTDGVLILPDKPRLLEVKSIGLGTVRVMNSSLYDTFLKGEITMDQMWWRIKRPFAAHIRQGMLYLRMAMAWNLLIGSQIMPKINEIVFIYEWKPTQKVKEFVLTYNEQLIDTQLAGAKTVADGLRHGIAPSRPTWTEDRKMDTPACRKCAYQTLCWSTNDQSPPGLAQPDLTAAAPAALPPAPVLTIKRASASTRRRALAGMG